MQKMCLSLVVRRMKYNVDVIPVWVVLYFINFNFCYEKYNNNVQTCMKNFPISAVKLVSLTLLINDMLKIN